VQQNGDVIARRLLY